MKKYDSVSRFHREVVAYYIQEYDLKRVGEMVGGTFADDTAVKYIFGDVSEKRAAGIAKQPTAPCSEMPS